MLQLRHEQVTHLPETQRAKVSAAAHMPAFSHELGHASPAFGRCNVHFGLCALLQRSSHGYSAQVEPSQKAMLASV